MTKVFSVIHWIYNKRIEKLWEKGEIQKELEWQYLGLTEYVQKNIAYYTLHKIILFVRDNYEKVCGSARMRELKYIKNPQFVLLWIIRWLESLFDSIDSFRWFCHQNQLKEGLRTLNVASTCRNDVALSIQRDVGKRLNNIKSRK